MKQLQAQALSVNSADRERAQPIARDQTSEGSFTAVSTPNLARKYSFNFCSNFRDRGGRSASSWVEVVAAEQEHTHTPLLATSVPDVQLELPVPFHSHDLLQKRSPDRDLRAKAASCAARLETRLSKTQHGSLSPSAI